MTTPTSTRRPPDPVLRRRRAWTAGPVTAVLAGVALTLMLLDLRGGPTDVLRAVGAAAAGPVQIAADQVLGPIRTGAFRRADAEALQERLAAAEDTNRRLQTQLDLLGRAPGDDADAAAARDLAARWAESAVSARVVAADPAVGAQAVLLDVGSAAGITPDSAVLVSGGVVGRVTSTTTTTGSVRLLTDPGSAVAVRVGPHAALLTGTGDPSGAVLTHLDPMADVTVGQRVTTLGSPEDRPFPRGLPVGTVSAVSGDLGDLDRVVTVAPAATAGTLDRVIVLRDGRAGS